jgi:LmbE family N-acetylglucosaminyl deacetylase
VRVSALQAGGALGKMNLAHLYHPDTFLNALRQQTARELRESIDNLRLVTTWDAAYNPGHSLAATVEGLLVQGAALVRYIIKSPCITRTPPPCTWVNARAQSHWAALRTTLWGASLGGLPRRSAHASWSRQHVCVHSSSVAYPSLRFSPSPLVASRARRRNTPLLVPRSVLRRVVKTDEPQSAVVSHTPSV